MKQRSSQVLHPIESLGVKKVSRGEIRIEALSQRLIPAVEFPHRHDFYQITFVTSGTGWHEIDFRKYKVSTRQLFFMKPGQVHSWKFAENTKGFVVEFTSDSLVQFTDLARRLQLGTIADNLKPPKDLESVCKFRVSRVPRSGKSVLR